MPVSSAISRVPQRWIVCVLCSLALTIITIKNSCFYSLVDMVITASEKKRKTSGGCPFLYDRVVCQKTRLRIVIPDFYWNPNAMDFADKAFHVGEIILVVPAGVLSDLGYSKLVFRGGMLLMSSVCLLLSVSAKSRVTLFVVANFFDGMAEAMIYPSVFTLVGRWALPSHRNLFTALVFGGIAYGHALGHLFFHLIYIQFKSWSLGQFLTGAVGLFWLVLDLVFIYHSPDQSPFNRQHQNITSTISRRPIIVKLQDIPWRKIVTSLPFLSLILAFCATDWTAFYNIWDPYSSYQKYILHLPDTFTFVSTVNEIAVFPASVIGGSFADWVVKHNILSKSVVKKTFSFTSLLFATLLEFTSVFVGCNVMLFWVLSITALYSLGPAIPVIFSSPIDLCSSHSGLLSGIILGFRAFCAIFEHFVNNALITDNYSLNQWQVRYFFYSSLVIAMMIPFLFFGSGEAQKWSSATTRHAAAHPDERATELQTS